MSNNRAAHGERLVVISLHPVVDDLPVEDGGDEVVSDALNLVGSQLLLPCASGLLVHMGWLGQNAAVWVNTHDLHAGNQLLELLGHAGHGSASTSGHDHVIQLAFALLGDLLGRAVIVGQRVAGVLVLVEHVAAQVLCQSGRQEDVAVLRIPGSLRGCAEDLCSQALHGVHLLAGHLLRQANDLLVAFDGRDHAKANTSVSTGGLNEDVTWLNSATLLSLLNHPLGNAVLHRAAGVEELNLAKEIAIHIEELGKSRHANHRGEANQIQGGITDLAIRPAALDGANRQLLEIVVNLLVPANVVGCLHLALLGWIVGHLLHLARASNDWIHCCDEAALRHHALQTQALDARKSCLSEAGHHSGHGAKSLTASFRLRWFEIL
mmetsp:Transcript_112508/g.157789  ORF Transcript_112508/g.157789 Transcript_112508/m.157789 type:complete len:379 (-) Transcript_112508:2-1138(-)